MLKEKGTLKNSLMLSGVKGVVLSGQDLTQLSFQLVKGNYRKALVVKKTIGNRKLMKMELKREPCSSSSKQKNLATLATWFWL